MATARTPPDGTTGLSWLSCSHRTCARVSAPESSGSPGSPALIEVREVPRRHAAAQVARRGPRLTPAVESGMRTRLVVLRDDRVVADEVEVAPGGDRRRGDEERAPPDRPIQLAAEARLRADGRVDAQLGAGARPRRTSGSAPANWKANSSVVVFSRLTPSIRNGGAYGFGTGANLQALPAVGFDELPVDGLVAIQPGEHRELGLERGDVERLPDVRRAGPPRSDAGRTAPRRRPTGTAASPAAGWRRDWRAAW